MSLLHQLELAWERCASAEAILHSKANRLITISGIVLGLLFGFNSDLLGTVGITQVLLSAVLIGMVGSILFSLRVIAIYRHRSPFSSKLFFDECGKIKECEISRWDKFDKDCIKNTEKSYLISLRIFEELIKIKVRRFEASKSLFLFGIINAAILFFVILHTKEAMHS